MLSSTVPLLPIKRFTTIHPTISTAAKIVDDLVSRSDVLLTPNAIVTLEPPIGPANPFPFDDCINTTAISKIEININKRISNVIIVCKITLISLKLQVRDRTLL